MNPSFTRLADGYPWLKVLLGIVLGTLAVEIMIRSLSTLYIVVTIYFIKGIIYTIQNYFTSLPHLLVPIGTALWLIYRRAARNPAGVRQAFWPSFILSTLTIIMITINIIYFTSHDDRLLYIWIKLAATVIPACWWVLPEDEFAPAYPVLKVIAGFTLLTTCFYLLQLFLIKGNQENAFNIRINIDLYLVSSLFFANWVASRRLHCHARDIRRALKFAMIPLILYFIFKNIDNIYSSTSRMSALATVFLECLRPALIILPLSLLLLPKNDNSPQDGKGYTLLTVGMLLYAVMLLVALIAISLGIFYVLINIH